MKNKVTAIIGGKSFTFVVSESHEYIGKNVVKVTYEGGTSFLLNFDHNNEVTVKDGGKEYTIASLDFIKVS